MIKPGSDRYLGHRYKGHSYKWYIKINSRLLVPVKKYAPGL